MIKLFGKKASFSWELMFTKAVYKTPDMDTQGKILDRGADLEATDHWLRTADPDFDPDGNPKWDGSRFDLDEVLSWMWVAEKTRRAQGLKPQL